jgi:hypothetical protein
MLDLKKAFGNQYKVFHDPSWDAETSDSRTEARRLGQEPWYYELRGPQVMISPRTDSTVTVRWLGRGSEALKRVASRTVKLDDGISYIIPNEALKGVLGAVRLHRKRQVTEALRARGKALAARYGFKKGI